MEAPSHTEAELREELKEKRKELAVLRSQLRLIYDDKEAKYKQLSSIRTSMRSYLTQIGTFKSERDQLTTKVKELKQQRDTFNTLTKEKSTLKEEAQKRQQELRGKLNPKRLEGSVEKDERALRSLESK